jgi:hypothetical protein
MPTPMFLFILFMVGIMAGAFYAYRLIVASRKASHRSDALHAWSEKPLRSWKYEPCATSAILIHTLTALMLGFLALGSLSNQGILTNPFLANDASMIVLVWFIQCGSILVVGYQLGPLLIAFPLIMLRSTPVAAAITQTGMVIGQNFLPWRWFSHFSVDSEKGIFRLYSAFAPDLPSLTLKLPGSIPLAELDETLRGFLALRPSGGNRVWYQSKFLLLPTMLMACLLVVVPGWLASHLSLELALFVFALLASFLTYLGGLIVNLFAFGVRTTASRSPKQPPAA